MADPREAGKMLALVGGLLMIVGGALEVLTWLIQALEGQGQGQGNSPNLPITFIVIVVLGIIAVYSWKALNLENIMLWGLIDGISGLIGIILVSV
ncbi:MAG: hypothetical protein ACFFBD_20105, partial [Candidatus Hodarchaeota archaeon]